MSRYKILIADDQELMRTVLVRFIQRAGYDVIAAQNGEEAVELYKLEHPALVISDIKMPKMNGLTLLKEIKRIDPRALIILITGFGSEAILLEALRGGAINFFKKPFKVEEVIEVVHHAVRYRDTVQYTEFAGSGLYSEEKRFVISPAAVNVIALLNQICLNFNQVFSEPEIINLKIGLEEMINNAIEHGCLGITYEEKNEAIASGTFSGLIARKRESVNDRFVHITSSLATDGAVITIRDDGEGFDWRNLPRPTKESILQFNGRGIFLTKIFFDSVEYNDAGNQVTIRKSATPAR